MTNLYEDLLRIADGVETIGKRIHDPDIKNPLDKLEQASLEVGKSWSGSWHGYHARVYYRDLKPPPPGAHFSTEWGLMEIAYVRGTVGNWEEYDFNQVRNVIFDMAGKPDLKVSKETVEAARKTFDDDREEILSILTTEQDKKNDAFLTKIKEEVEKLIIHRASYFLKIYCPSGNYMTRDTVVIGQGIQTPPHYSVLAEVLELRQPLDACDKLSKLARRAGSHLAKRDVNSKKTIKIGTNVFIGHGHSKLWKDLKDFIQDRLELPWDEFNRVPVAGVTNIARLTECLDNAAIAFLVMTAEDEVAGGKMYARLNVVHEAGLFQGRLGFTKAIILLEEGCEEFSNIHGLGQIRFPKGNIKAAFEEIRQVLEREGILNA